jgi:hypothetical protein
MESQHEAAIDFAAFFDYVCTPPNLIPFKDLILMNRFNGYQSDEIDKALSELIHPLDWLALERNVHDPHSGLLSLTSDTQQIHDAIITADQLKLDLNMQPRAHPFQAAVFLSSDLVGFQVPIVFDTGASFSLTPFLEDFVDGIEPATEKEMNGINSSVKIEGVGWVEWTIRDVFGHVCLIRTRAYYIPESSICLFSPQQYCKEHGKGPHGYFDHEKLEFTTSSGTKMTFPYSNDGNLPLMFLDTSILQVGTTAEMKVNCQTTKFVETLQSILSVDNHNMDGPKKELHLHYC